MIEAMGPTLDRPTEVIACDVTKGFPEWMGQAGGAIAISTYQASKVVMLGWDGRRVTVLPWDFDKPMGMAAEDRRLAVATRNEVTLLANSPELAFEFQEQQPGRYDALYLPRASYHTADLNVHDIGFGAHEVWIVATRFSCLASTSADFSFVPRWKPPFVTEVAPGDRCHLNGLAMEGREPRYATVFAPTNQVGGWREKRLTGGRILDVASGEVVAAGLCMPHSPRLNRSRLWVLNSGAGELLSIDLSRGSFEVVCVLPGYLRGLCFCDRYAVIGMGTVRQEHLFGGLPVTERFTKLACGVAVVDLQTGRSIGQFEFTAGCTELYDVLFLPEISRPMILNLNNEPVRQSITTPECSYWLRPSSLRRDPPDRLQ